MCCQDQGGSHDFGEECNEYCAAKHDSIGWAGETTPMDVFRNGTPRRTYHDRGGSNDDACDEYYESSNVQYVRRLRRSGTIP